ncbi:type IV pilin N-terminal domain-containing protein [Haloarcula sediminis]|uniref:type IV pilin N-terminal domain-containing protein n=1 Tax=Haloarcula sediminis TaxID=3111777 RepID=UPI002D77FDD6|nr:type IV pilin N-terminal domain-containing protein [Haloarcula sp. CK38]
MRPKLFRDDGVGAFVAGISLIVAAAIVLTTTTTAAFVLGVQGGTDDAPPQVNFTYEYSQHGHGNLTIGHESGERIDPSTVEITADAPFRPAPGNDSGTGHRSPVESYPLDGAAAGSDWVGGDAGAGTAFGIVGESPGSLETITVRIVWESPSDSRTAVIGEWRGPSA